MKQGGNGHTGGTVAFPGGGGEMGDRTRAFDWGATPVGPVRDWPQSLRTTVHLMLSSRYPMFVWWGPELINFYNDAYIPVLGARHPAALGRPAPEVWSDIWPTVGPQAEVVLGEARATWNEELLLLMERNLFLEETYFTFSYSPIFDGNGRVGGVFCACTEDTQRVLSQRRLRTLRALAAQTAEAASAEQACRVAATALGDNPYDLPFILLYLLDAEQTTARLAGCTGVEPGGPASPHVTELSATSAWPFARVAQTGRAVEVDDLAPRLRPLPGGAWPESPSRAVVLPVARSGQPQLAGFVVAGVSPRLPFTEDYRDFLDLVAGQVATAVAQARAYEEERRRAEALAELDRAKTTFFSNVSHEFRTPLTLMLGPIDDLLERPDAALPAAARESLEVMRRNAQRLLRLVNTLLDFSRIEAGRLDARFEPIDLAAATRDLASVFRAACVRAGLRLTVDCPPLAEPVFVDRDMWEKVVLNLVSNAFKFTLEGEIAVTVRQVGRQAVLQVRDTGTGIPAELMPRLFERFHRIENPQARTHEGSGIGLALVRDLVKLHGGSVSAESAPGAGTTITVALPLGSGHLPADRVVEAGTSAPRRHRTAPGDAEQWVPDASSEPPEEVPDDQRPRVLVADDNADMRQYIAGLLAPGHRVEAVADGEAALAAARAHPPDLIVTDVMMPRLDGFGLLRALRADPSTRTLPVIMLSARAGEESRIEGAEAGADDYLVKPFGARELLARVGANLRMHRLRRQINESLRLGEERYRSLTEAITSIVWTADAAGRFVAPQPSWTAYTGQSWEHVRDFGWTDALHPGDRDRIWAAWERARERGDRYEDSGRLWHAESGCYRRFEVRAVPMQDADGSIREWVGTCIDVEDRARAELALREADRRKDEFLATLAHELRNPLAPLRNGLALMKLAPDDDELIAQARTMMERQLGQLVRLVDDLLDVSRISRGRITLHPERVDLAAAVEDAVEATRSLREALDQQLDLVLPARPIPLEADATRLAQVVGNLLNNASKFTPREGRIRLTVERVGGEAVVRVADTGVGIASEHLPRVFEMFSQAAPPPGGLQAGLGIGLSLVRTLVELHAGRVEAHSAGLGRGSEFIVRLPVQAEQPPHRSPGANEEADVTRRRVLIVDDNPDAAESLAMLLRLRGHDVQTAHDGVQAVEAATKLRPDLVLLDIGLPEIDGYEAARRIRRQLGPQGVMLVALTGWGQDEDRRRSKEAGFDAHLVKPVDSAAMDGILASLGEAKSAD